MHKSLISARAMTKRRVKRMKFPSQKQPARDLEETQTLVPQRKSRPSLKLRAIARMRKSTKKTRMRLKKKMKKRTRQVEAMRMTKDLIMLQSLLSQARSSLATFHSRQLLRILRMSSQSMVKSRTCLFPCRASA